MARLRLKRLCVVLLLAVSAFYSAVVLLNCRENRAVRLLFGVGPDSSASIEAFGVFHFVWLGVCILAAVAVGISAWRYATEHLTDRLVFCFGIAFFLLEWYKQLAYGLANDSGAYSYSVFPFQFCSLPMYICLTAPMLGPRAKHTCYCFLALFGTVGGYLVMAYPNFPPSSIFCVHTMLWHTLMILLGAWLLVGTPCGKSFVRDFLPAAGVFLAVFAIAMVLNVLLYDRSGGKINLFYMSPYHKTNYYIIGDAQRIWGWGASVVVYLLLFLFAGAMPIWIFGAVLERIRLKKRKN